jgi:hypothetical protein
VPSYRDKGKHAVITTYPPCCNFITTRRHTLALVKEAAAAAKSLQEEADGLAQVVGVFKLKE